ncbi:SARP family transcriptional regulator [Planotetraspora thailandica]|uniref:SARP family transcriptional regulator n=1 Tax=Planotetraspora thailandica TaxID=487172 RepID=A0A8J3Y0M9_9ACTN|nr:BTAD domain-containing putative transcriptional regulator [Planotetraspora thailandica]GII58653.1 SARP family transcriptional regulator [Planotetraspora thailandica]
MRFRVLGDVTLVVDGHPAPLSSRRQEQLLALLVCAWGRVVPAETLVEAMWGDHFGPRAGKNLQVLVHRLRKSLDDPGRIRHDRSGYALSALAEEVDAWHFAELAEQARRALDRGDLPSAADLQRDALALWHGRPFAGLDGIPSLDEAAERLEQDRRRLLTERIDADLALGRHAEIIPELISMVAENPLAEAVGARLMLAMHRAGRRTEALDAYRRIRAALAGELGLEPGAQLRALEQAILRGDADASLDAGPAPGPAATTKDPAPAPDPPPFMLPAPVGDLTGRGRELRRLTAMVRGPSSGGPVICAVSGMPGVGKTALAVQAAHEVRGDFPDGQLYVNLRGASAEPVETSQALARFLRALGMPGTAIPDGLDERAEAFRARLAGRRVLVLLDDAADEAQVEPLIPPESGCAVLITSRAALTAVPGLPGTHRMVLGVLDDPAAVELLATITGRGELAEDAQAATRLAELCGRLPLALRIAGARLAARPHWTVERLISRLAAERDRLDELTHGTLSVRASLALGYSGLPERSRVLFRRLGLLETPDFAGWVAGPLLDAETRAAEDVLEGLVEARLVEYAGMDDLGEPRYRVHDLVRLHARERGEADEPPGASAAALTRLTGAYLALAELAHRRQYGGDYTVLHGDGPRWSCGETTASRLLEDPAGWLRAERLGLVTAVEQAAALGLSETCWDLAMTAITLFEAQGLFDDWRHTSQIALSTARRTGDVRGEAAMRYSLGTLDLFRQRYTAARPHLDAALALFQTVGDRHGQALTLRNAALIERVEGQAGTALRRYRPALRMLREARDRHAEAHVLGSIAQIHIELGRAVEATGLLETALAIYRDLGNVRGAAQILNRLGTLHLAQGRAAQAGDAFHEVLTSAQSVGDKIGEAYGLLGIGEARLLAGDLDAADARLEAALEIADEVGEPFLAARARLAAGRVAASRGDPGLAMTLLSRAAESFEEIGLSVWRERARQELHAVSTARPVSPH